MARKKTQAEAEQPLPDGRGSDPEPEQAPGDTAENQPHVWTMAELLAEYFPGVKRFSGGAAAGLERELRRRNRKAEKGY